MITFGAVIAFFFNVTLGHPPDPGDGRWRCSSAACFGAGIDLGIWRPLRRRGTGLVAMMIISIGLAIFLRYVILYQFGDRSRPFDDYAVQTDTLFDDRSGATSSPRTSCIIVASLVVLRGGGDGAAPDQARQGDAGGRPTAPTWPPRAGIDVNRIITTVWFLGGVLVTLGGDLRALSEQVNWLMGHQLLLLVFAGVTLGGLGHRLRVDGRQPHRRGARLHVDAVSSPPS